METTFYSDTPMTRDILWRYFDYVGEDIFQKINKTTYHPLLISKVFQKNDMQLFSSN